MTINDALELLKFYDGSFKLTLHSGANEVLINEVEHTYGITLPDDFKTLYRFTDGFELDEDIFNMIPLKEIIGNRETNKPIWIAEYMIYSDMWGLEINPYDHSDYSISVVDWDKGKIILTNSLAEFIGRFLKGGVFETGGLYHWKDEIKAKTYGNTNPDEIKPLLSAFRECLNLHLISIEEVIRAVDWIISTEDEPDNFFIRISRSRDLTDLLAILNSKNLTDDIIQVRVIFGVVYVQLLIDKMPTDRALWILGKFANREDFTTYEINEIGCLLKKWEYLGEGHKKRSKKKLDDRIKTFFDNYRRLSLYNYKHWSNINAQITKDFSRHIENIRLFQQSFDQM
jgi:hypothetical protein